MRLIPFIFASHFTFGCSNSVPKDVTTVVYDTGTVIGDTDDPPTDTGDRPITDTGEPPVTDTGEPPVTDTGEPPVEEDVDADGDGFTADSGDCDDDDASVHPDAIEVCDGLDNNCDGIVDTDATDFRSFYLDADGDGFGNPGREALACTPPPSHVDDATDCDDTRADVHPSAAEICDSVDRDEDCNGLSDDADPGTSPGTKALFHADADGDGFGDAAASVLSCDQPAGHTEDASDCDDTRSSVNPAATEVCDSANRDEDCDGLADDDDASADWGSMSPFYPDADGDGYGDTYADAMFCDLQPGFTVDFSDCNDSNASINPDAEEICDGVDNNCDGSGDEPGSLTLVYTPSSGSPITVHRDADQMDAYSESDPFDAFGSLGSGEHVWTFCQGDYAVEGQITEDSTIRSVSGDPADVSLSGGLVGTVFKVLDEDIQVRIEGVTIEEGLAEELIDDGSAYYDVGSGGGLFCQSESGSASVIIEDSRFESNQTAMAGGLGGGIFSDGCSLDLRHTVFQHNESRWAGGAIYVQDADLSMENVELRLNSSVFGSAVFVLGDERDVQVDISSSLFIENENEGSWSNTLKMKGSVDHVIEAIVSDTSFELNHGGLTAMYTASSTIGLVNADVLLENVAGADLGVTQNEQPAIRMSPYGAGTFLEVVDIDFGTAAEGGDNLPYDVAIGTSDGTSARYDVGNNASFICEARPYPFVSACSNDLRNPDGDPTNDEYECHYGSMGSTYSQSSAMIANTVTADRNSNLESFSFYLGAHASCELDFYLLEKGEDGEWSVLSRRLDVEPESTMLSWHNSGSLVNEPLEAGVEYAMAVGWDCPSGDVRYWRGASSGTGPGFGEESGHFEIDEHLASTSYGVGHAVTPDYTGSSVFRANVVLTDLDSDSTSACVD